MREAAGVSVDRDEDGWRRLTGDAKRDLNPITRARAIEMAVYLWRSNPLARSIVELPLAYLLAEGVALKVADEDAQGWLDAFWRDPINRMDIKLLKKARELSLFGEQCWPAFVNEMNGHVRLGYVDPAEIETVVTDPENCEQPIGVVLKRDRKGRQRRYRVIVNGPEDVFCDRTREIRATFADGECFYFSINDLSSAPRGASDLLALADWLDGYDQALFGELDRWDFLRAFIWDVKLTGASPEEVEERARKIDPPSPGSVRVHNDNEEWRAEVPSLNAADSGQIARLFRNHAMGGAGLPEHWFGGGGDVNRATAGEMSEPTFKLFTMRQTMLAYILEEVATYVIRQRLQHLFGASPEQSADPESYKVMCEFPELTAKDTTKYAAALQQAVVAVGVALDRGLLCTETAVQIITFLAERLGVEIDPARELERIAEERAQRRAEDGFALDDTDFDDA